MIHLWGASSGPGCASCYGDGGESDQPLPSRVCSPYSVVSVPSVVLNSLPNPRWLPRLHSAPTRAPCCLQAGTPWCLAHGPRPCSSHPPPVSSVHSGASQTPLTVPFTRVAAFSFLWGFAVLSPPPGAFVHLCPCGSHPLFNSQPRAVFQAPSQNRAPTVCKA